MKGNTKQDIERYKEDSQFLEFLYEFGLTDWDDYDEAIDAYNKQKEENNE